MSTTSGTFTLQPLTGCREALIARINEAITQELNSEILYNILISLIECTGNADTSSTGTSDGVVNSAVLNGNTLTLLRSNGLAAVTATVNISTNTTIVTINNNIATLSNDILTNTGAIAALNVAISTLLSTVSTDNSLSGDGTVGNPLSVKLAVEEDNIAEVGPDGGIYVPDPVINNNVVEYLADEAARLALVTPLEEVIYTVLNADGSGNSTSYTFNGTDWVALDTTVNSGGASSLIYTSGNCLTKADGLGVSYSLAGNTGTIIVPNGVKADRFRVNESYTSIGDSETFYLKIVDNGGFINESLANFYPFAITVIERDIINAGDFPDNSGSVFRYEAGSLTLNARAGIDIVEVDTLNNFILYRFTNLGNGTKWSILLS